MKIAIIGTGKTGGTFLHQPPFLNPQDEIIPFNTQTPPTLDSLQKVDVAIIFVPGPQALPLLPLLLKAQTPCVWGTTGMVFPDQTGKELQLKNLTWIHAHNYAPGMNIIRYLLTNLKTSLTLISPPPQIQLTEWHHQQKKDAPSGTALSWQKWLGSEKEYPISSIREGDIIGIHELQISTPQETITIKHEAKDRSLFAQGAYLAAQILHSGQLSAGLIDFDQVTDLVIQHKITLNFKI